MDNIQMNISGSLEILENIIKANGLCINTLWLIQNMPKYTLNLEVLERSIFTGFYWRKMSMLELSKQYGMDVEDIKRVLDHSTNKFLKDINILV